VGYLWEMPLLQKKELADRNSWNQELSCALYTCITKSFEKNDPKYMAFIVDQFM
jgi:hypothetical protein